MDSVYDTYFHMEYGSKNDYVTSVFGVIFLKLRYISERGEFVVLMIWHDNIYSF